LTTSATNCENAERLAVLERKILAVSYRKYIPSILKGIHCNVASGDSLELSSSAGPEITMDLHCV
jgi:hypothetical protein